MQNLDPAPDVLSQSLLSVGLPLRHAQSSLGMVVLWPPSGGDAAMIYQQCLLYCLLVRPMQVLSNSWVTPNPLWMHPFGRLTLIHTNLHL